jgi:class 3 adenylate cyclase/tetratricopeptide (TPR) repeat protein
VGAGDVGRVIGIHQGLAQYVPPQVLRRFAADPSMPLSSFEDSFPAAVLFADISGFTAMGEALAQRGPAGAEELQRMLNDYLGRAGSSVASHGGEVIRFAGDALLAAWPAREQDLPGAVHCAGQCALEVQRTLGDIAIGPGLRLSLRAGIGAGTVSALHVGGVAGKWFFVLAGLPLAQMTAALHRARPGEVALSPEAAALAANGCRGQQRAGGVLRLQGITTASPYRRETPARTSPETESALAAYVPDSVLAALRAGHREWLAELRLVTPVFVNLIDFDPTAEGTEKLQRITEDMQTITGRYEGTIKELTIDDKGTVLITVFGLPPLVHEDDVSRATQAALEMGDALQVRGVTGAIGVATKRAFCGPVGSEVHREYTVVGDVMNLASRLAQAAPSDVVCDGSTHRLARGRMSFETLPPVVVKGRREPVALYRPIARRSVRPVLASMFGREHEEKLLAQQVHGLINGEGAALFIEGEPGIGKSRLVAELVRRAEEAGVTAFVGGGDAIERAKAYHAWRGVFGRLFGVAGASDVEEVRARVLEHLRTDPDMVILAPLLNSVLPVELPNNEVTAEMTGAVRADNTTDLLVRVLQSRAGSQPPILIVLEDAHWMDSSSWLVARLVSARVAPLLLVLASRPLAREMSSSDRDQLLGAVTTGRTVLDSLPYGATVALVKERLGVEAVSEPVARFVFERGQGNPFFTDELTYALRDAGVIRTTGGTCELTRDARDLLSSSVPEALEGVIATRIDRLSPSEQLTLKVASVIGRVFSVPLLRQVHPIEEDRPRLDEYLSTLERQDMVRAQERTPDRTYIFKHVITQEVAYHLLLFAQRHQLHRRLALWYEQNQAQDLSPFYPLLAHHWGGSEDVAKTIEYSGLAGGQAVHKGAYQEALGFLGEALRLDAKRATPSEKDAKRRARWERQLGEAHLGLGQTSEGREHLEHALDLLHAGAPDTRVRLAQSMMRQVSTQVAHRLAPRRFVGLGRERETLLEASRAYIRLTEVYWFANDTPSLAHAGLRALNLAENAGSSPELARALAIMCISAGSIPSHKLARAYGRRAVQTAKDVGESWPLAYALFITSVYAIGTGAWDEIQTALQEAGDSFERLGDRRLLGDNRTVQAMSCLYRGDFSAARTFDEVQAEGMANHNVQHQVWGLIGKAECSLRKGRPAEAEELLGSALTLLTDYPDRAEQLRARGLLAVAHLRRGDRDAARRGADQTAELIRQFFAPTAHYLLEGYAGPAEVMLSLSETGDASRGTIRAARRACRSLRKFARVFPIGEPRARLLQGRYEWLSGRTGKARRSWEKSLLASTRLGMVFEEALAHREIGRHAPPGDTDGARHLDIAALILSGLDIGGQDSAILPPAKAQAASASPPSSEVEKDGSHK